MSCHTGGVVKEYEENYEIYMAQQSRAKEVSQQFSVIPSSAIASSSKLRIASKPKPSKGTPKARGTTPTWTESEDDG
jgi:hypothetical protein